ncbi:TcdA/TcdB catalytic glycosyltransferase domain-containing protein [Providencia alcalifaciens]|uniref:Cysteine protease domain, YopT-type n=2 Tax=Providencia alcalifaciens TaxID=126385 RepID=A0AAV3M7I7_9GAMM|nr:TcdA/TcdB catalytic glycosyltransferase domain-containing protein [Providencia alcalifaciens]EUD11672.1 hypothetical protein HMPREF1563_0284 [Providencia alcalifaciens 205/92]MTC62455.1 DUF3491 domain-containing protein [Providencia alcalifaciens]WGZ56355.1 TcdA/TcdB catalytic glycosyltransferase domain-containing protein [Providencia alcalifaciens]
MRVNTISLPSQQERNPVEKTNTPNAINRNNKEKITHEPFINRITKVKNTSTDEVIAIGKLIQEEIRKTINPVSPLPVSTTGNWKSAIMHRLGLLMSGDSSQISLIDSNNAHQPKFTSVIPQASSLPFSVDVHHPYNEQTSTTSISSVQYVKVKKIKKRSLDNIEKNNMETNKNKNVKYSLSKDNIENKIFNNSQNKQIPHHLLLEPLKKSINSYNSLSEKNSREGIELLKEQANLLSRLHEELNEKSNGENYSNERSNILKLISEVQNEYMSHKVEIEKLIHVVWVAGAPPESITKYAHAYKNAYPEFTFNLWIDPNAMSAYLFNKEIKEIAFDNAKHEVINLLTPKELETLKTKTDLTPEFNEKLKDNFEYHLLKCILRLQDAVMRYAYVKGVLTFNDQNRLDFLKEVLSYDDEKINKFKSKLQDNITKLNVIEKKLAHIFGPDKIKIHNVNHLPEMKIVNYKQNYQKELILRANYAAASDMLRTYILKNHGGIYADYDVTPGYTQGVYKIIQENSQDFDFLEKEEHRRALNDELLTLVSGEPSSELKNKLSSDDKNRLNIILNKIKDQKDEIKVFAPINTEVIRDSMLMSKRHQFWGTVWNVRGNNNFLATHKGSRVMDFVIDGQKHAYQEIWGIREQLRREDIGKQHSYYNPNNNDHLEPLRAREKVEAKLFVSDLESNDMKLRKKENLKTLEKDLTEYGKLLALEENGVKKKDIRATPEFLKGYKDSNAVNSIPEFKREMNIKNIISLMKKYEKNLSPEQKGALAYEVESRALAVTFQPRVEEYHQLFEKVKSDGELDPSAKERLIPQLFLLNLVGDGFGGRCDPLAMLLLTEKFLESKNKQGLTESLVEKLYSTAAVLSEPIRYTDTEVEKAKQLINVLARLHAKNPMYSTNEKVWKDKKENQSLNEIIKLLHETNNEPILLKLEAPGHAMAAWSIKNKENRIYGFYDPNGGLVEFSSINKLELYIHGLFEKSGLNKAIKYHLNIKDDKKTFVFNNVITLDGEILSKYKTAPNDKTLKEILEISIFDSKAQNTKKVKKQKIIFDPKKYNPGSLFSHYRMDGIIPKKYSTLQITGPDAIMRSIKNYYNSLGALGQCRLDQSDNRFKGLGESTFVGNLKEISGTSHKHYDWVNQKSVGINDITPDDESTWLGKKINIKETFANINSITRDNAFEKITPTGLDLKKLQIGWPSELKQKLNAEWPTLEKDYNQLISSDYLDLDKLSDIDRKIYQYLLLSENSLVRWVGISLSDQLYEKINKSSIPIENKAHYLLTDINKKLNENQKSINSILASNHATKIIIWESDFTNKLLIAKELTILTARKKEVMELIKNKNKNLNNELNQYCSLKNKEQLETITNTEKERLSLILTKISDTPKIASELAEIEKKLINIPISTTFKINDKEINILNIEDKNSLKNNFNGDGDAITLWDKYITNKDKIKNALQQDAIKTYGNNRVEFKNILTNLKENELIKKITDYKYSFNDIKEIIEYGILQKESGVIINSAALAAPSNELVNIILNCTGGNDSDAKILLKKLYDYLFNKDDVHFGPSSYEQSLKVSFMSVLELLDKKNLSKYFLSVMNQNVSALGVSFSSIEGNLTSDIMIAGMKDGLSNKNTILDRMNYLFNILYQINNDIKTGKSITVESIKTIFKQKELGFMLQSDSLIHDYLKKIENTREVSLTEMIQGFTGRNSFLECVPYITADKYPTITNSLLNEIKSRSPSIYSMSDSTFVEPKMLKGLGYIGNDSYLTNPILGSKLHDVSISAKYQALQWSDFYGRNALLWQDTAIKFEGKNVKFHPQILLTPQEGRCMGLAELYLRTNSEEQYNTLQTNLDLASALYQESQNQQSQLSESDKHLLTSIQSQIEHAQQHGNSKLLLSSSVNKIRLSDFETKSVADYLIKNNIIKLLITTPFHSIIISKLNEKWRVTDPNFGGVNFSNLEKALSFIEQSINISPEVHRLYTGGDANASIDIHFVPDNDWNQIVSYDALELTSRPYQSTLEKISTLPITISIKNRNIPLVELYKFGVTVEGKRIDEKNINGIDDASTKLKINGNLLNDYLSKYHLNEGEVSTIHYLLSSLQYQPDTQKVKLSEVIAGPSAPTSLLVRLEHQRNKFAAFLKSELTRMSMTLIKNGVDLNSPTTKVIDLKLNRSLSEIDVSLQTSQGKKSVKLDVSTMGLSFKESFDALQEGFDAMHLDEIMSILGIMQYAKMAATGEHLTSLDHANHVSDLKTLFDSALGLTLLAVGEKSFGTSVSQIKLETIVATKIQQIATKFGGATGSLLTKAATVIKLPLLDTALNLWSLGDAVQTYLNPNISSEERLLAGIDIGFATTYTSLALLGTVFPPLALSTIPIYFFQQEVKNLLRHNHHIDMRRKAWLSLEHYLNESSKLTILAKPEKKLLDLSPNKLLGGVTIDLSVSPPTFNAYRSYNDGRDFGNHAHLSDQQVKESSGYAKACTSTLDIPEIHLFGSIDKVICNDNAKHEYQLAKGYANRLWPPTFPVIPKGDYTTVILGYSARIIAYTEAKRMNDGTYKELARTDHVLMHKDHKSTIITCSDNFTTFAIPPLEKELFLLKNQDILHAMKESWFTLKGGKNGMILQTNGIGNVDFQGQPHTQNILSFKNLGQGFSVHVNLNQNSRQTVVRSLLPYLTHHSSKMMDLIQNNINTLIGSDYGYDTFIGNQYDNHFTLGAIGGTVHLGGGNNVVEIPVPDTKTKVYRTSIHLSPNSGMQYFKYKGGINDIDHITYNDDSIYLFFDKNRNLDAKRIEIHAHKDGDISEYVNKLVFSTEDGLNLKLTEDKKTFTLESANMTSWRKYHKNNELDYELIINSLYESYCKKNTCIFFDELMKIFVTNKNIECIINKPDISFNVPTNYSSITYGESGVHYISNAINSEPTTIILKNSASKIEHIDISPLLVPVSGEKIAVYAKVSGSKLIITVHKGSHQKEYTLLSSDSSKLDSSLSRLEFSNSTYLTLLDIYKLVSTSQGNVLIFECN